MSACGVPDREDSKSVLPRDIPAPNDAPPHRVWLQKLGCLEDSLRTNI